MGARGLHNIKVKEMELPVKILKCKYQLSIKLIENDDDKKYNKH